MTWKPTKNPEYSQCGASDFLSDEFVPQSIRDEYQEFIDSVDVAATPVNDRGYKEFEWEGLDWNAKKRYTVTWNDRFRFGAMRGPIPKFYKREEIEKEKEQGQAKLDTGAGATADVNLTETNRLLQALNDKMDTLLERFDVPKPAVPAS